MTGESVPPDTATLPDPNAVSAPTDPQIGEIEDAIGKALDAGTQGKTDEAAKLKQQAIRLVDRYYGIKLGAVPEPKYVTGAHGESAQTKRGAGGAPPTVEIYDGAFVDAKGKPSARRLASTKIHEVLGHCALLLGAKEPWKSQQEAFACNVELLFAGVLKLSAEEIQRLREQKADWLILAGTEWQAYWQAREKWLVEELPRARERVDKAVEKAAEKGAKPGPGR